MARDPDTFVKPDVRHLWTFLSPRNDKRETLLASFLLRRVRKILDDDRLDFGEQLLQVYLYLSEQKQKLLSDKGAPGLVIDIEIVGGIGSKGARSTHKFTI